MRLAILFAAISTIAAYCQPAPPPGFIAPPLNPTGAILRTEKIGDGVYALLSSKPFTDNGGFIVGDNGVLVIDANYNARMAGQILDAVKAVTSKPILFLVNTNGFPDHTFGNYVFPADTHIIGHRLTVAGMTDLAAAKTRMLRTVDNDASVYADAQWRKPDVIFDDHLRIDLGGRFVDIHYFGPGNTPGDTIVFEPQTRTAWTGNMVFGEGTIPWMNTGGFPAFPQTIAKFAETLQPAVIVPGHGVKTTGAILTRYQTYLTSLRTKSLEAIAAKQGQETVTLDPAYLEGMPEALIPLMKGFHIWNVQRAFQTLNTK